MSGTYLPSIPDPRPPHPTLLHPVAPPSRLLQLLVGGMRVAYREGISTELVRESEHDVAAGSSDKIKIVLAIKPWDGITPQRRHRAPGGTRAKEGKGSGGKSSAGKPAIGKGGDGGDGDGVGSDGGAGGLLLASGDSSVRLSVSRAAQEHLLQREVKAVMEGLHGASQHGQVRWQPCLGWSACRAERPVRQSGVLDGVASGGVCGIC
mgnify:CR=1 FL=1